MDSSLVQSIQSSDETITKNTSDKLTFEDSLRPNEYLLNFLGLWPRKSPNDAGIYRVFTYFRIIFSTFVIGSILFVPEIFTLVKYWGNIFIIADVGSVTIEVAQLVFKLFYMLVRRKKFYQIYQSAKKLWSVRSDDQLDRAPLEDLAKLANKITISLFTTGFANICTFVPISIIDSLDSGRLNGSVNARHLPLEIWYGIDTQRSPIFEIALFCQMIAMIYAVIGISGFDATMMTLILHVCGHFRLVRERFRELGDHPKAKAGSPAFQAKFTECIAHHQRAIRVADEMRELLSPVIFVQLMSSGLEICLCGYMLLAKGGSSAEVSKYVVYTVTMFLQLVLWCWPGELLIRDSRAIGDVLWHELPWYRLPASGQRDFGFVILRARKACCVSALSFQVMSLQMLTEVFNTAASYFTLLRSVTDKELD